MGKDGITKSCIRQLSHHRNLQHSHNLSPFETQDHTSQNLLGISIHNGFHETSGFVHLQRTSNVIHRHLSNTDIAPLSFCLCLTQSNTSKLWIDEDGIRD